MEKDPRKEKQNPVEKAQQVVAAVESPPDPVERVGKFHYPQTFVGDVVKVGIRRGNPVNSGSSLQELFHKRTL